MKIKFYLILLFIFCLFCPAFAEEDLSALLGGSILSDKWLINRDKQEEEFIGNLYYKNDIYFLQADYGLSKRKEKTYLLKGNILASQTLPETFIQIKAEQIFYNNKTSKGYALGKKNKQLEVLYKTPNNTFTLYGDRADFNKKENLITVNNYAELSDLNNTLYAQTITYNTQSGVAEAFGKRPVLFGFGIDGDYALQADKINVNTESGYFKAEGKISGWITMAKELKGLKQENLKK